MTIPVSSLQYYDESKSDWNLEKGKYFIYVGNASNNIIKKLKVNIVDKFPSGSTKSFKD